MNEELEQVREDIRGLQDRLYNLYNKEKYLKRGDLPDLVGKYIYQKDGIFEMYMRVDKVEWNDYLESYEAGGPAVDITTRAIGINYVLSSNNKFSLSERYELSDEEAYNCAFGRAVAAF